MWIGWGISIVWWIGLLFAQCSALPRPYDDPKNLLFYSLPLLLWWIVPRKPLLDTHLRSSWFFALLGGYAVWCVLSLCGAGRSVAEGIIAGTQFVLWGMLIAVWARLSVRRLLDLAQIMAWSTAFVVVYGAMRGAIASTFIAPIGHATYYGDLAAVAVIGCCVAPLRRQRWQTAISSLAIFALLYAVWFSGTRTSVLAVAGILLANVVVLLLQRGWPRGFAVILLCAVVLGSVGFSHSSLVGARGFRLSIRLRNLLTATSLDGESSGRLHLWRNTLVMVREHPLRGVGLGMFRFAYPEYAHRAMTDSLVTVQQWCMHPHNELLHQLAEVGVPGAIVFVLLWIGLLVLVWRASKRTSDEDLRCALWIGVCGVVAVHISWMLSTNFLHPLSRAWMALFVALIVRVHGDVRDAYDRCDVMSPAADACIANAAKSPLPARERGYTLSALREWWHRSTRSSYLAVSLLIFATLIQWSYHYALYAVERADRGSNVRARVEWSERAYAFAPGVYDTTYRYAMSAAITGNLSLAAARYAMALKDFPSTPGLLYMAGMTALQLGDTAHAREYLTHATRTDPAFTPAHDALQQLGDAPNAR